MKYLTNYKLFESYYVYNDRDKTNLDFSKQKGWVDSEEMDKYITIKQKYNITSDEIGDLLEDITENCNLLYKCVVNEDIGNLVIEFIPNLDIDKIDTRTNDFKEYIFPYIKNGKLIDMLDSIENKLSDFYPHLTIKDPTIENPKRSKYPEDRTPIWLQTGYHFYMTFCQITLYIRKI